MQHHSQRSLRQIKNIARKQCELDPAKKFEEVEASLKLVTPAGIASLHFITMYAGSPDRLGLDYTEARIAMGKNATQSAIDYHEIEKILALPSGGYSMGATVKKEIK